MLSVPGLLPLLPKCWFYKHIIYYIKFLILEIRLILAPFFKWFGSLCLNMGILEDLVQGELLTYQW